MRGKLSRNPKEPAPFGLNTGTGSAAENRNKVPQENIEDNGQDLKGKERNHKSR